MEHGLAGFRVDTISHLKKDYSCGVLTPDGADTAWGMDFRTTAMQGG